MNANLSQSYVLFALVFGVAIPAFAAEPGESIVKDPKTGNYTITYCGTGPNDSVDSCILRQVLFVPAIKIEPSVRSFLKSDQKWNIQYRYAVTNGHTSPQSLISFSLEPLTEIKSQIPLSKRWTIQTDTQMEAEVKAGRQALSTPAAWQGDVLPSDKGGLRVTWFYKNTEDIKSGLSSGRKENGFGFYSPDLPGIGVAEFSGNAGTGVAFVDAGPIGDIAQQLSRLQSDQNFVYRYVALPTISVSNPFNAATVLRSIQQHSQTWVAMQLLDPALSSQFNRLFQAAIDAANRNDAKTVNAQLKEIRKLAKNEHPGIDNESEDEKDDAVTQRRTLIAKLAAQVLNFDLKYIIKRLGGDDS